MGHLAETTPATARNRGASERKKRREAHTTTTENGGGQGEERTARHRQTEQVQGLVMEVKIEIIEEAAEMDAVRSAMAEALMATEREAAKSQENRDARGAEGNAMTPTPQKRARSGRRRRQQQH